MATPIEESEDDLSADAPPPSSLPPKSSRPQWLAWALGSGAFAAFNGLFAKLYYSETSKLDLRLVWLPGTKQGFFGLNVLSNAIMWILFTRALTAASSTTRVSILNTSANFLVSAIMGMFIFGEGLPLGWWAGAGLLVAGSVIIGAREEAPAQSQSDEAVKQQGIALANGDTAAATLGSRDADLQDSFRDDPGHEQESDGAGSDVGSRR